MAFLLFSSQSRIPDIVSDLGTFIPFSTLLMNVLNSPSTSANSCETQLTAFPYWESCLFTPTLFTTFLPGSKPGKPFIHTRTFPAMLWQPGLLNNLWQSTLLNVFRELQ